MLEGTLHPDFHRVARVLERQLRKSAGGAAVCVYHRGECVVDLWAGRRDRTGAPWERDTTSVSFSTSKGVLATLLHVLVDQGRLDYDDPVARHWPEFARAGKQGITVRQLLCHEAGLYGIRHLIDDACRMLDWGHMVTALEEAKPLFAPGTANGYHGLTFGWLVGELVQRVGGKPLPDLIEQELAGPLGLDGLYLGVPARERHRAAVLLPNPSDRGGPGPTLKRFARAVQRLCRTLRLPLDPGRTANALLPHGLEDFDFSAPETIAVPIPAANGHFTARSLARLYAALAAGGTLDGVSLIRPETLAKATEVQNRRVDLVVPFPMHWRLGYHRVVTSVGRVPTAFGHFGFGGSGAWADPETQLAVALVLNSGVGTPFGDLRILQIGGAALAAARAR